MYNSLALSQLKRTHCTRSHTYTAAFDWLQEVRRHRNVDSDGTAWNSPRGARVSQLEAHEDAG